MVFDPLFEEKAEAEIVQKIMVVVDRDTEAALDYRYAADNLPPFAVMTEGGQSEFTYPLLTIVVQEMASEESASGEWLEQELLVGFGVAVSGATIKEVRLTAKKYVWALKAVLRKSIRELLPDADEYTEYSVAFRHRYFQHESKAATVIQPVDILMRIRFGET